MPVYLSIKNPFQFGSGPKSEVSQVMIDKFEEELLAAYDHLGDDWIAEKVETFKRRGEQGGSPFPHIEFSTAARTRVLQAGGYDGIRDGSNHYAAFEPSQIKSATGNNGAFDGGNPNILFSYDASQEGDLLEGQTPNQVKAQEAKRKANAKARSQDNQSDDDFVLTGSDSEADQAAARGQQPLFSQSGGASNSDSGGISREDQETKKILNEKLNLGNEATSKVMQVINAFREKPFKEMRDNFLSSAYEAAFDGLIGIKRAEDKLKKGIAAGDYKGSGYVGARMATGIADVMKAILTKGAPQWRDGVSQHKEGTKGLLDIFSTLGDDLNNWLGWMAGNRAAELMAQGREANLTGDDVRKLRALSKGKERKFQKAKEEYMKVNSAMLDFAQDAGLINAEARKKWESDWYVPFYRRSEEDGDVSVMAPTTTRGLSNQSAGIKRLTGKAIPTEDLLNNILSNYMKIADASMKNMALIKTIDNLEGSEFITEETARWQQVNVRKSEVAKLIKEDRKLMAQVAEFLGMPKGSNLAKVANQLARVDTEGFERMWTSVAPTHPDVVRVQKDGRNSYYRVHDKSLLRAITHVKNTDDGGGVIRAGRAFRRLLTTGVTSAPDFILRNFIRDGAHGWAINPDGFKFGKDSLTGLMKSIKGDAGSDAMMFGGASFQGGYINGADPQAAAFAIRRELRKRGLNDRQIKAHMATVVNTPQKAADMVVRSWEKYREFGDNVENANRLSTFIAARNAGKDLAQALYESKDLMDYSMRGNHKAMMFFVDTVPFLNARMQGLSKLGRVGVSNKRLLAPKLAKIGAFSVLLAALNDDDERYQELEDWEKDAYWHIFMGDSHWRIPKPFEIGVLAGTIPERIYHTWLTDNQPDDKLRWSLVHGITGTLGFNPLPQALIPVIETWGNRSFYFDSPIESMSDQNLIASERYNSYTSDTMIGFGRLLGMSPKKLQHIWEGYTGTMGGYALSLTDMLVRGASGEGISRPSIKIEDLPLAKSIYRGEDPKRTTQYITDFYDSMDEVNKIYATMSEKERTDPERRQELYEDNRDKLRYRSMFNRESRNLSRLRARRSFIMNSRDYSSSEKSEMIDDINKRMNTIAKRASDRSADAF